MYYSNVNKPEMLRERSVSRKKKKKRKRKKGKKEKIKRERLTKNDFTLKI